MLLIMWLQCSSMQVSTSIKSGRSCERPEFKLVVDTRPIFGSLVLIEQAFGANSI